LITLFIDTSLSNLIIAIVKDNKILASKNLFLVKNHSEHATEEIKKSFQEASLTFNDIDQIMVVNGPGSFTGLRIGVTIAKTMAFLLNKEIIPVNSLTMRALNLDSKIKATIIDARRDAVYAAIYDENMNEILKPEYIELQTFKDVYNKQDQDKKIMTPNIDLYQELNPIKDNLNILKIVEYYKNHKGTNHHNLNPDYHKKTEAEEKRNNHE